MACLHHLSGSIGITTLKWYRTAQLIVVLKACVNRNEDRAVEEEVDHDPFSRLSQELQKLWPRPLLESQDLRIAVETESALDVARRAILLAMSLSETVTQEVFRPRTWLLSLEKKPYDKVNNLGLTEVRIR